MKNLFNFLVVALIATFAFTACNKSDDFDWDAAIKEQQRQDSIEKARVKGLIESQADALEEFANINMPGATHVDSLGIWYIVDQVGQEDSYTYRFNNSYGQIEAPDIVVKYKGTLLNGTVFDQTTTEKPTANFNLARTIPAWQIAFLPRSISLDGKDIPVVGLTIPGLKKGSKIRFVTSSPYAYDKQEIKEGNVVKIPANSPLYFEIEVVNISRP